MGLVQRVMTAHQHGVDVVKASGKLNLLKQGGTLNGTYLAVSRSAKVGDEQIANYLNVNNRSVRKYKDGTRMPSAMLVHKLINLAEKNNIQISNYKRD